MLVQAAAALNVAFWRLFMVKFPVIEELVSAGGKLAYVERHMSIPNPPLTSPNIRTVSNTPLKLIPTNPFAIPVVITEPPPSITYDTQD